MVEYSLPRNHESATQFQVQIKILKIHSYTLLLAVTDFPLRFFLSFKTIKNV
ncbi:predicted protein [Enterococcus faecium Com12]|nr:predicted protein [Enterococcus faecium Com12]